MSKSEERLVEDGVVVFCGRGANVGAVRSRVAELVDSATRKVIVVGVDTEAGAEAAMDLDAMAAPVRCVPSAMYEDDDVWVAELGDHDIKQLMRSGASLPEWHQRFGSYVQSGRHVLATELQTDSCMFADLVDNIAASGPAARVPITLAIVAIEDRALAEHLRLMLLAHGLRVVEVHAAAAQEFDPEAADELRRYVGYDFAHDDADARVPAGIANGTDLTAIARLADHSDFRGHPWRAAAGGFIDDLVQVAEERSAISGDDARMWMQRPSWSLANRATRERMANMLTGSDEEAPGVPGVLHPRLRVHLGRSDRAANRAASAADAAARRRTSRAINEARSARVRCQSRGRYQLEALIGDMSEIDGLEPAHVDEWRSTDPMVSLAARSMLMSAVDGGSSADVAEAAERLSMAYNARLDPLAAIAAQQAIAFTEVADIDQRVRRLARGSSVVGRYGNSRLGREAMQMAGELAGSVRIDPQGVDPDLLAAFVDLIFFRSACLIAHPTLREAESILALIEQLTPVAGQLSDRQRFDLLLSLAKVHHTTAVMVPTTKGARDRFRQAVSGAATCTRTDAERIRLHRSACSGAVTFMDAATFQHHAGELLSLLNTSDDHLQRSLTHAVLQRARRCGLRDVPELEGVVRPVSLAAVRRPELLGA